MRSLLRGVSRSFYLSLVALPREVRPAISLAYLLARAGDTIADEAPTPLEQRQHDLQVLRDTIDGLHALHNLNAIASRYREISHPEEQRLMQELPQVVSWLAGLSEVHRSHVQQLLPIIYSGQMIDLTFFGASDSISHFSAPEQLEDYLYRVAGCVGEFWTRMIASTRPPEEREGWEGVLAPAVHYGKGLQLINILRDLGEDWERGRCYLPLGESAPDEIGWEDLEPLVAPWAERCREYLADAVLYSQKLPTWRWRFCSFLPAVLAVRTLRCWEGASWETRRTNIKITRCEVRRAMVETAKACFEPLEMGHFWRSIS